MKCEMCETRKAVEHYDKKILVCNSIRCQLEAQESIDKAEER